MNDELNNETWMMRSARLDKPTHINKLLRQGFEPFWGFRVNENEIPKGSKDKPHVRMYFRKPPTFVLAAVEEPIAKFDMGPLEEFTNQFRSALSGVLDTFLHNFFTRLSTIEKELDQLDIDYAPLGFKLVRTGTADEKVRQEIDERGARFEKISEPVVDPEYDDDGNPKEQETDAPRGDDFRVVNDVPQLDTAQRTDSQNSAIEGLRSQGNITVLPGLTESGEVRVMLGADLYTIERDGNFTVEKTKAGTDSTIVGG